ncbi:hypothetical protein [Paenibacillus sp. FSL R5-0908]|uniref:hypothetical protein n=1 Tax=Paenibacillus sp. FSL R5-0908 TaxID=2921664 RepID=UPI0030F866F0
MICANIVTTFQRYEITLPPKCTTVAEGFTWLQMGIYSFDKPDVTLILPDRTIYITDRSTVLGIDVWEVASPPEDLQVELFGQSSSPELPVWMDLDTTYLGNRLVVQIIYLELRGCCYALPNQINGQPAFDVLDPGKLGEVTQAALHQAGMGAIIVIPPQIAINSQQDAVEYLMDYAEQATPAAYSPAERTGQAIRGLWDDKQ